jgi:hypothetical protein
VGIETVFEVFFAYFAEKYEFWTLGYNFTEIFDKGSKE